MVKKILSIVLVYGFLVLNFQCTEKPEEEDFKGGLWKAGVSRILITPAEPMWMAGYAARNRPAEGKLVDLWAKALVLEDKNGNRAVLVTTDLLGYYGYYLSDRIRSRLNSQFGFTNDRIILSSSHTHTGPEILSAHEKYYAIKDSVQKYSAVERKKIEEYTYKLEEKIVNLVGAAVNSMVEVKVFSGSGSATFAVNRRNNSESSLPPSDQLKGPVDHSVPVMKVEKLSGGLLAVVFGYACHATTLSFYQWSGDYPGFAQLELESLYPGSTAMFFAGAGADQNPLPRKTVELARHYGTSLAGAVNAVISEPMQELSSEITAIYSEVNLEYGRPLPGKVELLEMMGESSGLPVYIKRRANILLNQLEDGMSFMPSYPYPVQVWRIGEQTFVILGGEVVVDYSLKLKEIFGKDIFVMAYSNEMMGYIPSERVLGEGGYEGSLSGINGIIINRPWASGIEERIINEVKDLAIKSGVPLADE
ncbi:MAG: neutral/alkaline non-lysosomal ceramidase N-terminal domain-containing protein [Prolixibacteraceae bacterium]|nr:neutral/alkaline non-lysosomal ceramidase N-terminal domain-containing protein [Prolixibacteraceae bacterium]